MNLTEAMEEILKAAEQRLIISEDEALRHGKSHALPKLAQALRKIRPRVEHMRERLDFSRAKKAGKQTRPSWATP
jgi:acyl-coenzyme A synthetase/AMP-(fatty) acid ligase